MEKQQKQYQSKALAAFGVQHTETRLLVQGFPRAAVLFLCSCQAFSANTTPLLWANSSLGSCFSNKELLLSSLYGPDYAEDENIVVRKADFEEMEIRYHWITDATPKINQTKYLARTSMKDSCIILFAPSAGQIDLHFESTSVAPERITTSDIAGPGFKPTKIIYQYNQKLRRYEPDRCFAYYSNEDPAPLACSDVYRNR